MIVEQIFEEKKYLEKLSHLLLAIPPARKSSSESSRSGGEKVDKVYFQIVIRGNFFLLTRCHKSRMSWLVTLVQLP